MNNGSARVSNTAEHGAEATREAFGNVRDSISEAGDAVRRAARETAQETLKAGRHQAGRAVDAAHDAGQRAAGVAQNAASSVSSYIRAKPVEAALIGLSGLLLASLLMRRR